jgi:hypothetical protein
LNGLALAIDLISTTDETADMVLRAKNRSAENNEVTLPDHLVAQTLSFLDASDFLSAVQASQAVFSHPLREFLGGTFSLSLSFLLRFYPNTLQGNARQQIAIQVLMLHLFSSENSTKALRHLELANLRGATGVRWLPQLVNVPLITLDLSNNVHVDPRLLKNYLNECPTTLRHLHLTGCSQVTPDVLDPLTEERHSKLRSLSIGGCSQSIQTQCVLSILRNLRHLQHFNLQSMNHIHDRIDDGSPSLAESLPNTLKSINLTGTRPLRLLSSDIRDVMGFCERKLLDYIQRHILSRRRNEERRPNVEAVERVAEINATEFVMKAVQRYRIQLENLVLDGTGLNRSGGIGRGVLFTFSFGRSLREVHLAGCETVLDWEISYLAHNCGHSLTCFQMRGTKITSSALEVLAECCKVLAEVDVSACQNIRDDAIIALSRPRVGSVEDERSIHSDINGFHGAKRRRISTQLPLKVLRVASNLNLTDVALQAISSIKTLHLLDIHDCPKLTPLAVHDTARSLPELVDLNAKDIGVGIKSLTQLLRNDSSVTRSLKFVNGRSFVFSEAKQGVPLGDGSSTKASHMQCCTVRNQSQRLSPAVPLQSMYHCVDCNLIPSLDRGMCAACREKCHKGHKTYLGSYTRFYCDCPFGVESSNHCQAIFPVTEAGAAADDAKPAAVSINERHHS